MTLRILRLCALRRAPAESPATEDRSLVHVLWLLLFMVFAPVIGLHVAFVLVVDPAAPETVQSRSSLHGKHG
jgi:hypothetical protein